MHFSCIGFRDLTRVLVDGPSGDVTLNVRMQFTSNQLKQVEVTELKKQTGAMSTIDTEAMRRSPDATGGSVESLLATQAGVQGADELSSRYSVRGGAYDENSVYINGIEVYRPQLISSGQQEGLSIINPDLVGAIGFSTGGYPAEYGDNISSVLDITYRTPSAFEGRLPATSWVAPWRWGMAEADSASSTVSGTSLPHLCSVPWTPRGIRSALLRLPDNPLLPLFRSV